MGNSGPARPAASFRKSHRISCASPSAISPSRYLVADACLWTREDLRHWCRNYVSAVSWGDSRTEARRFREARNRFAYLLNVTSPQYIGPPPGIETDSRYGLVLTTHMSALAAVVAHIHGDAAPPNPAELSAFLLAREREHWRALRGRDEPLRTVPHAMGQTVYTATLTGPLDYRDSLTALRLARIESTEDPGQLLRDHALCYPPQEDGNFLEPLYPDRLGEDFLALSTPGHNNRTYPADPWTLDALIRLLSSSPGKKRPKPSWAPAAMSLLTEIGTRWPHIASLTWAGELTRG